MTPQDMYVLQRFINKSPLYTLYTWYCSDKLTLKIQNQISHSPFIFIYISVT